MEKSKQNQFNYHQNKLKLNHVSIVSLLAVFIIAVLCLTSACTNSNSGKADFSAWNDGSEALSNIKAYVTNVTDKNSSDFIPEEDRIACFDMDGVVYCENAPVTAFTYFFAYRVLDDPSYSTSDQNLINIANRIKNIAKSGETEESIWKDLTPVYLTPFSGMSVDEYNNCVDKFLNTKVEGIENATYKKMFYKPMLQVIDYLNSNGFKVYINTGSGRLFARETLKDVANVCTDRVIGADITLATTKQGDKADASYVFQSGEDVLIKDKLESNICNAKLYKNIDEIGKTPCVVFGNSSTDLSMLNYSKDKCKYKTFLGMVVSDDSDREQCPNVQKANTNAAKWNQMGFQVVSVKNDYKTLYLN